MERFKAFSVAYQRLTVYVSKDVRDQLFAIRSKVVSIVNRHGLARDPNLNAPELWRKIIDDFEELGRFRDAMAETIHRMLV